MGIEYDLSMNLLAAAMGAAAGGGISAGRRTYRSLRSDTFWRFLRKPTLIVVGELHFEVILGTVAEAIRTVAPDPDLRQSIVEATTTHIGEQETSGLMGRGDFDALTALNLKHLSLNSPSPSIVFDSTVRDPIRKQSDPNWRPRCQFCDERVITKVGMSTGTKD